MKKFVTALTGSGLMFLLSAITEAGSAEWDLNPGSGDWNTAANWTPMMIPNGSADTATFALSNTTAVSISANTEVNGITFTAAATNPYTITVNPNLTLTISGTGITNNSGITQNFVTAVNGASNGGQIVLMNSATAGTSTTFTNNGASVNGKFGGGTIFLDTSTAGNGTFTNNGGAVSGNVLFQGGGFTEFSGNSTAGNGSFTNNGGTGPRVGGQTLFLDSSSAGNGNFTNNGGTTTFAGGGHTEFYQTSTAGNGTFTNNGATVSTPGLTFFFNSSTAGNGTFINNGATVSGTFGGSTEFRDTSTADSATLIANGGTNGGQGGQVMFEDTSAGGTSRVEVFGNGNLDISFHNILGVTVGSIEGDGNVFLGANSLTVGSNNLSTTFSGVIQDGGGNGGTGGSLTKIGTGTLDLTGANTYTGNTNINGGVLHVDGSITSNTFVNRHGTLAGTGAVFGNVTNNNGGTVGPGDALGTLTVNSYTQMKHGTLLIDIAGLSTGEFSVLDVLGNANLNGILHPVLLNGFIPTVGESFIFMDYTALTGAFSRIQNQVFDHGMEHWLVTYQSTDAVLTAESGPRDPGVRDPGVTVPDQGSTFLLLTLSLLGLVTYRQKCVCRRCKQDLPSM
jgi:hypothetical protein